MRIVNGSGIINPDICFVGEAPGETEEAQGLPFVGQSGELLNKVLKELGIDRESCYITNAVKFRPEDNRTPTEVEILTWQQYLEQELWLVKPLVVVTLGKVALKAVHTDLVFNDFTLNDFRGKTLNEYVLSGPVVPTFHPSYILRKPSMLPEFLADIERAKKLVEVVKKELL